MANKPNFAEMTLEQTDRRRSPRYPLVGVLVTIVSSDGEELICTADAIDISKDGISLVLPEELDLGDEELLLTFRIDGSTFARVPGRIVRRDQNLGAVDFEMWSRFDRLRLGSYLDGLGGQPGFRSGN